MTCFENQKANFSRANHKNLVFLRQLEYYAGILFLTTNRLGGIDEAFKSRIHISLRYPSVDLVSTKQMWTNIMNRRELMTSKALAGYMSTSSGRRLAFALFVNNVHINGSGDTSRHGRTLGRLCEIAYEGW